MARSERTSKSMKPTPGLILISILLLATLLGPIVGTILGIPAAVLVVTLAEHLSPDEPSHEEEEEGKPDAGHSTQQGREIDGRPPGPADTADQRDRGGSTE